MSEQDPRVIVALDFNHAEQALKFSDLVTPDQCRLKVGKELFTSTGPDLVRQLVDRGYDVFLDLKFHDIPNTVHKAVAAACELGVWMLNVHALGGLDMMKAAREAVDHQQIHGRRPWLIAVSILTSTNEQGLQALGIQKGVQQAVVDLTSMALEAGMDGMVCSAQEVLLLRQHFGAGPLLVTPGIRPSGADIQDQQRIMTPEKAIKAGSSYLVIGRPITQHADPLLALRRINQSIQSL